MSQPEPDREARIGQAAEEFSTAMFTDVQYGLLLRLVRAEIADQEQNNCERFISATAEAGWHRELARLRAVQRKLQRQRIALRAGNQART